MSQNVIQPSFAAGELSPTLYARVDFAKYHVGLARCLNFFVDYRGGASTRTGTGFIARALVDNLAVRLIPFQFSSVQELPLVFGDHYMQVVQNGALVLDPAKSISTITNATPTTFTSAGHGYSNGTEVFLASIGGISRLSGFNGITTNVTVNTFQLTDRNGNLVSTIADPAYTGGGTVSSVFTLGTPYAAADLALLKFTQSADVMTLTHPSYPPYDLTRLSNTSWTLTPISIGSKIANPVNLNCVITGPGAVSYAYVVTAVNASGDESTASARFDVTSGVNISATAGSISMTWDAVPGAVTYNIYKAVPALMNPPGTTLPSGVSFGYIGTSTANNFIDGNIVADFTVAPPTHQNPLAGNNPSVSAYFQQRKGFFASNASPETMWFSKTGQYENFDVSSPVQPNDAITATLVSRQINAIKSVVGMPGGLVLLTAGGAWQVSGGAANAPITPATITATPQAYNGASDLQPLPINYDILYVQSRGAVVRDLAYNFYTNIYTGTDISILSNHFFHGYTIPEWAYAEEPFKLIWAVRSDGVMLSCTYIKEQELIGWAQHKTLGQFKSVIAIQEGAENFVYVVVRRLVQGQWVQYIERMASRLMPYGVEDAWALDSALISNLNYPTAGLTASATDGANVTFTADAPVFNAGHVGWVLRIGGGIATITEYVDAQTLKGKFRQPITDVLSESSPVRALPALQGEWSLTQPFTTFTGLDHLEGQTVSILGDGNVFSPQVVVNGQITLNEAVTKAVVGLSFVAQMQTLYLDTGEPTSQGKRKKIAALTMRVDQTRGLKAGPSFDQLTEFKMRHLQPMGSPIALQTGDQRLIMTPQWNENGQISIEQAYPLPATVLGVIPEIVVGDK